MVVVLFGWYTLNFGVPVATEPSYPDTSTAYLLSKNASVNVTTIAVPEIAALATPTPSSTLTLPAPSVTIVAQTRGVLTGRTWCLIDAFDAGCVTPSNSTRFERIVQVELVPARSTMSA